MKKFRLFSYNPPAKGVEKEDERASVQTDFPGFFIMYGRKFWNISNVNLLMAVYILILSLGVWLLSPYPAAFYIYLAFCALLFGIFNAGTTYLMRGYVRGDPVYIFSDFKYALKHNFLQSVILGIIDIVIVVLLVFDIFFWSGMDMNYLSSLPLASPDEASAITEDVEEAQDEEIQAAGEGAVVSESTQEAEMQPEEEEHSFASGLFFYACIFLLIIYSLMRCYMYLILVTFKLSIPKILKNSFIFAFLGIKRNILAFLGIGLVCFINFYIFVYVPVIGLVLPLIITTATCSFIGAYAAYPVIKKYMITPYYKDEEVYDSYDERIFTDRG